MRMWTVPIGTHMLTPPIKTAPERAYQKKWYLVPCTKIVLTHLLVMTRVLTVSTGCVTKAPAADEAAPRAASAQSSELPREVFRH